MSFWDDEEYIDESPQCTESQSELYVELATKFKLTDKCVGECDYFTAWEGDIDGIVFYTPNDETWGCIIAISHEHKLAHFTSFYEMDDMSAPHLDYHQVVHEGQIKCHFETED